MFSYGFANICAPAKLPPKTATSPDVNARVAFPVSMNFSSWIRILLTKGDAVITQRKPKSSARGWLPTQACLCWRQKDVACYSNRVAVEHRLSKILPQLFIRQKCTVKTWQHRTLIADELSKSLSESDDFIDSDKKQTNHWGTNKKKYVRMLTTILNLFTFCSP